MNLRWTTRDYKRVESSECSADQRWHFSRSIRVTILKLKQNMSRAKNRSGVLYVFNIDAATRHRWLRILMTVNVQKKQIKKKKEKLLVLPTPAWWFLLCEPIPFLSSIILSSHRNSPRFLGLPNHGDDPEIRLADLSVKHGFAFLPSVFFFTKISRVQRTTSSFARHTQLFCDAVTHPSEFYREASVSVSLFSHAICVFKRNK